MRKFFICLLCTTVAVMAAYIGCNAYCGWKQKHFLAMAQQFYAQGDERNALLSLRLALHANPRNLEAVRLVGDVLDANRSREALLWRARAVELDPRSTRDRLALANTALVFDNLDVARSALDGIADEGRKTSAYHTTAGALAIAARHYSEAREQFAAALRLEPSDPTLQFNVAMVDLRGSNDMAVAQARATLQRLSLYAANSGLKHKALTELITDDMRLQHQDSALALSGELARQTNATFADRLIRLEVLHDTRNAGFKPMLTSLEREASTNSGKISQLAFWEQAHDTAREGLMWLNGLPADVRTNQPAALLSGEFYIELKDWRGLQQSLEHQNWAAMEFLRYAFLARALREQELVDSSKSEWERALQLAGEHKMNRMLLVNLADQWGWQNETEELLWTVVSQYPTEQWADQALTRMFYTSGRTRSLLELFSQEVKSRPSDLVSKHNLAAAALLLDEQSYKPYDLAKEVYEKAPTNAVFASTYAFALWMQKKNAQALNILANLKPSDLENPLIAGYYGLVLQANGHHAEARRYLDLSAKSAHLPEEQRLFETARRG